MGLDFSSLYSEDYKNRIYNPYDLYTSIFTGLFKTAPYNLSWVYFFSGFDPKKNQMSILLTFVYGILIGVISGRENYMYQITN